MNGGYGAMSSSPETKDPADLDLSPHASLAVNGSPPPGPPLAPGTSGSTLPAARSLPGKSAGRGRGRLLGWAMLGAIVLGGGGAATFYATRSSSTRPDVLLHKVKKEDLHVTVTEKGTLES